MAQLGSFSAAARSLHVAQPALSRHVRDLEDSLGVALLARGARGVTLTREGEELFAHGARALEQLDTLSRVVGPTCRQVSGRVVIGVPNGAAPVIAAPLLEAAMREYPQVRVHLIDALSGHLKEWIDAGRLDLAVVYDALPDPALRLDPIVVEDLWLVGATGSLPADGCEMAFDEAVRYPLVIPGPTHSHRRLIESIALGRGGRLDVRAEVDSRVAQLDVIRAGLAFAFMPQGAFRAERLAGQLEGRRIVDPTVSRSVSMVSALARSDNQACNAMARLLLDIARRAVADGHWPGRTATRPS